MRAAFISITDFEVGQFISISDETYHHLVHVVRVKIGDDILLLNGKGAVAQCSITSISKKELVVVVNNVQLYPCLSTLEVLLLIPKKEALELSLKICVEMGVRAIHLLRGDYSVEKFPSEDKLFKTLKLALEQSNNPWLPELQFHKSFDSIDWSKYRRILLMDVEASTKLGVGPKRDAQLLVVGPEGGFSVAEKDFFNKLHTKQSLHIPGAILRTPTAVAAGLGWLYAELELS